jgi:hypothetical protein
MQMLRRRQITRPVEAVIFDWAAFWERVCAGFPVIPDALLAAWVREQNLRAPTPQIGLPMSNPRRDMVSVAG